MYKSVMDATIPFFGSIIKSENFEATPHGFYDYDGLTLVSPQNSVYRIKDFVKKVYFNEPYTIVIWADGTKTIVKCSEGCKYNKYTGFTTCFLKKMIGDQGYSQFKKLACKFVKDDE